jgi:hypothetical protein
VPLANRKCVSPEGELRQAITAGKLVDLCDSVHGDRRVYRADARRHLRAGWGPDAAAAGRAQAGPRVYYAAVMIVLLVVIGVAVAGKGLGALR